MINIKCLCNAGNAKEDRQAEDIFSDLAQTIPFYFASPADVIDPAPSLCKLPHALGGNSCLSCRGNVCVTLSRVLPTVSVPHPSGALQA